MAHHSWIKCTAVITTISLLVQLTLPGVLWAGSSQQPEFSSLDSSISSDLVDPFSGKFQYSIPVLELPGAPGDIYTMNLNYQSGNNPYQDASWVGMGWSLSPGAIVRQKNGLPDDFKNEPIHTWSKTPMTWGMTIVPKLAVRAFGSDKLLGQSNISLGMSHAISYESVTGWSESTTTNLSTSILGGHIGESISRNDDGDVSWGANAKYSGVSLSTNYNIEDGWSAALQLSPFAIAQEIDSKFNEEAKTKQMPVGLSMKSTFDIIRSPSPMPLPTRQYEGLVVSFETNLQVNAVPIPIGQSAGISANYRRTKYLSFALHKGYGLLYNALTANLEDVLRDYHKERDRSYHPDQIFAPVPLADKDQFYISGPGISGSMELSSAVTRFFKPTKVESSRWSVGGTSGININVGQSFGVSPSFSMGLDETEISGKMIVLDHDEKNFLRMRSDPAVRFEAQTGHEQPDQRVPRSTYIGFNTNGQMLEELAGKLGARAYSGPKVATPGLVRDSLPADGIGEVFVLHTNGTQYEYALPVYEREEVNMSYSLSKLVHTEQNFEVRRNNRVFLPNDWIPSNEKLKNETGSDDFEKIQGQVAPGEYASAFLITAVKGSDYEDLTDDGPTPDDLGTYLRYSYTQAHGRQSGDWFRWRNPYLGFYHVRGQESEAKDDLATMQSGERETYYLQSVHTKTHAAVFHTSERHDQLEAFPNESSGESNLPAIERQKLQKLDRIETYAIDQGSIDEDGQFIPDAGEKPLKTVSFEYDYSICGSMPNSKSHAVSGQPTINTNRGVLTLKQVWTEYNGVKEPMIHPYRFEYDYKDDWALDFFMPDGAYTPITEYGNVFDGMENPSFSTYALDRWGNPQNPENAADRLNKNYVWNDQQGAATFDPGAWQLKQIQLPAGGEIHVQYEQHRYRYVHDKEALVMTVLDTNEVNSPLTSKFYPDLGAMGVQTSEERAQLLGLLKKDFSYTHSAMGERLEADTITEGKEKVFFKFLFDLTSERDSLQEYFEGLCSVLDVGADGPDNTQIWLKLGSAEGVNTPRSFARRIVKKNMLHKVTNSKLVHPDEIGLNALLALTTSLFGVFTDAIEPFDNSTLCQTIDASKSFLRLPLVVDKKGGGCRVKRILFHDEGLLNTDHDNVFYGQEYQYILEDGTSSGVASAEPQTGKFESALYGIDERVWHKFQNTVVGYLDLYNVAVPEGESLLPGPAIGYARVIQSGIFKGKSNTGHSIREFYTYRDEPLVHSTNVTASEEEGYDALGEVVNLFLPGKRTKQKVKRHYHFELFNMHGRPKSISTYSGIPGRQGTSKTSESLFHYASRDEMLPTTGLPITPGKSTERVHEHALIESEGFTGTVAAELTFNTTALSNLYFPVSMNISDRELLTSLTTDITNVLPTLTHVESEINGIKARSEHVVFDPFTAIPRITATTDEYDEIAIGDNTLRKRYFAHSYPAYEQYPAMGPRYQMERLLLESGNGTTYTLTNNATKLEISGGGLCEITDLLTPGDLLELRNAETGDALGVVQVSQLEGQTVNLHTPAHFLPLLLENDVETDIFILRSGRTNQLTVQAGAITTYQETPELATGLSDTIPHQELAGRQQFVSELQQEFDAFFQVAVAAGEEAEQSFNTALFADCDTSQCTTIRYLPPNSNPTLLHEGRFILWVDCFDTPEYVPCALPESPGTFTVDSLSGEVSFIPEGGCAKDATPMDCLPFCQGPYQPKVIVENVLDATAVSFVEDWTPEDEVKGDQLLARYGSELPDNPFSNGMRGNWRPKERFAFKTGVRGIGSGQGNLPLYDNTGIYENFVAFNWQTPENNDARWIEIERVNLYSPDGIPVETENTLSVPSVSVPAYDNKLYSITALNAEYNTVLFESFEKSQDNLTEAGLSVDNDTESSGTIVTDRSHTGRQCLQAFPEFLLPPLSLPNLRADPSTDVVVRFWASKEAEGDIEHFAENEVSISLESLPNSEHPARKIAEVGHWTLFETYFKNMDFLMDAGQQTYQLRIHFSGLADDIFVDDIKVYPATAQSQAFVYDPLTLQLVAQFDDNHFAIFYQYSREGELLRVLRETERGIKTVREQHRHLPDISRTSL